MTLFLITLLLTVGIIALCFIFLGISKLLTGKSKLRAKRCGNPEKGDHCPHCDSKKICRDKKTDSK